MEQVIKQRIADIQRGNMLMGYQRTKLGIIPVDWQVVCLGNILHNAIRKVAKPQTGYWRLGIRSHAKGTFREFVEDPTTVNMDELYSVQTNDLVVNITFAWEHAIAIVNDEDAGLLVSHRFPTYVFNENASADFYKYVITQQWFKEQLDLISPGGAGRNRVMNKNAFLKIPCYAPPLEEQRRIAEILGCCDRVIALKKELIAEKKKQKKALMQKLLNPDSGFRLPGFSGEWETYFLRDLYDFKKSTSIPRSQLGNSGIAYLHYGDIHQSTKYHIDVLKELNDLPKLSAEDDYSKYMLLNGDVVFVDASEDYDGVSKYTVIKNPTSIPFVAGLHTIVARSKNNLLAIDFQQFCFQNECVKQQFFFYASGMKVFGLNAENLGKIKISIPNTDEQQAIADILSAADKEIDLLEQELAQQEQKKKSLMQLLLTGIVRV